MINLLITKKNFIKKILFFLILIIYSNHILGSDNRIIFKINDKAFTLLDIEKRAAYLDFVGNNDKLSKNVIIDDFISANLFYEYYKNSKNKNKYQEKINEIYKNILEANTNNNKQYNYEFNKIF